MARVEGEITRFTTVQYRSPEMVDLYSGYPIGLKADIWALGVLLYHLCFFQLPFNTQLAIQTAEVAIPDASAFSTDIHKLIKLCLQVTTNLKELKSFATAKQKFSKKCKVNVEKIFQKKYKRLFLTSNLQTNPKDRPDIWQLCECVFVHVLQKPNPIENLAHAEPIDFDNVTPLPSHSQLQTLKAQHKEASRYLYLLYLCYTHLSNISMENQVFIPKKA